MSLCDYWHAFRYAQVGMAPEEKFRLASLTTSLFEDGILLFTNLDDVLTTWDEPNEKIGFFMPYEAECNPHYEEVRQHSTEWVEEFGLAPSEKDRRRLALGDYTLLCAYFLPRATRDQLALASDWITWEFILDDLFSDTYQAGRDLDGARAAVSHFVPLLLVQPGRIPSPRNPIECGLVDLWQRTVRLMSPTWRIRFFRDVLRFAESFVLETSDLAWGSPPDLVDHIQTRRAASGGEPMFELLEYTMGFELPPELCETRAVTALRQAAIDAIMHVNDIFSVKKERAHGDVHNNVYLVEQTFGCDRKQATTYVNDLAASAVRLHQRLIEKELPQMLHEYHVEQATRERVLEWAELTRFWLPGNVAWHRATRRYGEIELWAPSQDHEKWGLSPTNPDR